MEALVPARRVLLKSRWPTVEGHGYLCFISGEGISVIDVSGIGGSGIHLLVGWLFRVSWWLFFCDPQPCMAEQQKKELLGCNMLAVFCLGHDYKSLLNCLNYETYIIHKFATIPKQPVDKARISWHRQLYTILPRNSHNATKFLNKPRTHIQASRPWQARHCRHRSKVASAASEREPIRASKLRTVTSTRSTQGPPPCVISPVCKQFAYKAQASTEEGNESCFHPLPGITTWNMHPSLMLGRTWQQLYKLRRHFNMCKQISPGRIRMVKRERG